MPRGPLGLSKYKRERLVVAETRGAGLECDSLIGKIWTLKQLKDHITMTEVSWTGLLHT